MNDPRWQIDIFESGPSWTGGGATYGYALYEVYTDEDGVEIRMYNSLPDYQKKKFIESHDASIMALPR